MNPSETRILIIDDESAIRRLLKLNLEASLFQVEEAESGELGLEKATSFHPHLIILDLGLPDLNGFEVLKRLREWTSIPVLVLTVTDDEATKVKLLDAGADDYLTKPFGIPELLARIRVSLRHGGSLEATPIFRSNTLSIDISQKVILLNGHEIKLTSTELNLLKILVREHGKIVPQKQLLQEVWGLGSIEHSHYLRIYIAQLRKKIEADPSSPRHILTEPGIGYRLI
jgi:two-component system KDP operon response regulator KdpE